MTKEKIKYDVKYIIIFILKPILLLIFVLLLGLIEMDFNLILFIGVGLLLIYYIPALLVALTASISYDDEKVELKILFFKRIIEYKSIVKYEKNLLYRRNICGASKDCITLFLDDNKKLTISPRNIDYLIQKLNEYPVEKIEN